MTTTPAEDLLRRLAPQVLGALVRRYGHFDAAEDAVQEALLAAAQQWPRDGTPDNPRGWLIRVASRRLVDELRAEEARRRREETVVALTPDDEWHAPPPGEARHPREDDTLTLLLLCCHPALSAPSRIALTLRAVGGLTTAEIARAMLVPEPTMAQRISRAKKTIQRAGARFAAPTADEFPGRLAAVLHVLYLVFNEGHTATSGQTLHRAELAGEAIRLARAAHRLLPRDGEVTGLLALMLLTDARRAARTGAGGELIPLAEQDRTRWNRAAVDEGVELLTAALAAPGPLGPYQVQAAIAAVHDEATGPEDTDWPQILALYDVLVELAPGPVTELNRAVAVAMALGPQAGLDRLAALDAAGSLADHHRLDAVRGHLLEMAGDHGAARAAYQHAAARTLSVPERRYLQLRAAALGERG
ncbi:RNA polymerase sigma factor [Streptomyces hainanensis]|uniref:Sigma-70 family RNA polymerase sigma factor n=1 Tax=Streptomyces hainanensis TaxID=402648 RepID=A0A4V2Y3Z0_9ACTN|nr:sigma-70 family RNA polymerase sigma factor [Streptomyces hainanensis]TDC78315.1 sigma-70 family RNA polymerase sigma factor [Streptomyces hainanensis]